MSLPLSAWPAANTSPGRRLLEQPLQRPVAGAPEIGGDAGPVEVHVDRQRRRRGVIAETPLLLRDARPASGPRRRAPSARPAAVPGLAQLLEVLREEHVVAVVLRRARSENRASISSVNRVALTPEPVADVAVVMPSSSVGRGPVGRGGETTRTLVGVKPGRRSSPQERPHRCDTLPRCGVGPHSHRRMNATVVLVCRAGTRCAVPRGIRDAGGSAGQGIG